jgi:hypothetical protein
VKTCAAHPEASNRPALISIREAAFGKFDESDIYLALDCLAAGREKLAHTLKGHDTRAENAFQLFLVLRLGEVASSHVRQGLERRSG